MNHQFLFRRRRLLWHLAYAGFIRPRVNPFNPLPAIPTHFSTFYHYWTSNVLCYRSSAGSLSLLSVSSVAIPYATFFRSISFACSSSSMSRACRLLNALTAPA